jgi:hypothetical protein
MEAWKKPKVQYTVVGIFVLWLVISMTLGGVPTDNTYWIIGYGGLLIVALCAVGWSLGRYKFDHTVFPDPGVAILLLSGIIFSPVLAFVLRVLFKIN